MISDQIALSMIYYNKPIFFLCSLHIHSSENPIHGGFSQWSYWGHCSRPCGGGIRHRYRYCNNPRPNMAEETVVDQRQSQGDVTCTLAQVYSLINGRRFL